MKKKQLLIIFLIIISILWGGCTNQQMTQENIIQVACGNDFSLFLYNTGKVLAIGKNTSGQLGVGDTNDRFELTEVRLPNKVKEIGASDDSAYALTENNTLYTWGDNRYRQAKNSDDPCIPTPTRYQVKGKEKVTQFALGWYASYAMTESGTLYGWGNKLGLVSLNDYNYEPIYQAEPIPQSGKYSVVGSKSNESYTPQNIKMIAISSGLIMGLGEEGTFFGTVGESFDGAVHFEKGEILKMASGRSYNVLLTQDGDLYQWGENFRGELGSGDLKVHKDPQFKTFDSDPVKDIAVGPNHIIALTRSGKVIAWGDNSNHQLGLAEQESVMSPLYVDFPEKITYIATGFNHSYAIGESGKLYAFGSNEYGQLMTGDQITQKIPKIVDARTVITNPSPVTTPQFEGEVISTATMESFLTKSGNVFTKGSGEMGTLGTDTADNHEEPTYVPLPDKIVQIDAGLFSYTVLTSKGEVYNWGNSQFNSLGHGEDKWYPTYTEVSIPQKITKIRCGIYSTAAQTENGNWYMWGDNSFGGLATGDMNYVNGPVKINTPVRFSEISPSRSYWLALTENGEVYQWGTWKTRSTEDMYVPDVQVENLKYQKITLPEKGIKVKSASYANYVLTESGNLYIWGQNVSQEPKILLKNIIDFVASPREEDLMALTQDGKVYYWGGLLGNPYSPVEIKYPEKIISIFPGEGVFYVAGQENMYIVYSSWIREGMKTNVFPQKLDYQYTKYVVLFREQVDP